MSQEGIVNVPGSIPSIPTNFVTDSGTAVPVANTINFFSGSNLTSTGSGNTVTYSLTGLTSHDVLVGNGGTAITAVAPSATSGIPLISNGVAADPSFGTAVVAGGGTGSTSFNINGAVYSNTTTTGPLQAATLTSGQLLIGGTTTPAAATLTAGAGISITNGNNSITIAIASGATAVETLTGNSGGTISPISGNINTVGTGSITIAGAGNTLTTQLTGLTNHSLLVGAGTATITNLGVATNGQLPIGSTGADPVLATLTAGTGISITNGAGTISIATNGSSTVNTLTGNTGGAISPTAGNINTLGTGSITIAGSGSTLTTQLTGLTNHNVLIGAGTATITNVAPSATSGIPLISQGAAADPAFGTAVVAGGGTGSTSFNINGAVYSNTTTTGVLQAATLTSGQLLIGGTTTPAAATLTAGTGISITNGNNSITIAVASGTAVVETLTGNSGGAISPTAGNINTLGTGSITIAGSGSTLTTQLTGLTNHNVLVGAGTATITNVAPSATAGIPLVSNGSSSDPSFTTALIAGGGTASTSFNINGAVYSNTTTTGALQAATLTSGQLLIGGTTTPAAATLTPGAGIAITNGNNTITIAATGAGFTWSDQTTSFNAVVENGYFTTGTTTATLPASPSEGNTIKFVVDDTNILTITANTGQKIRIGSAISAAAGTASNNARGDSVTLVYRATGTTWMADSVIGTWTVT